MAFTAADVKKLREMTGVGMMDCKKALTESNGDMDAAIVYLREKGLAAAEKKAGRVAAEGMVLAETYPNGVAVAVEVNSETDFVAKNEEFKKFVANVAKVVAEKNPADVDALMNMDYPEGGTVADAQRDKVLVIGENIKVRRFVRYEGGVTVPYIHAGGKVGVLVGMEPEGIAPEAVTELGRDIAMQACAMSPKFLRKEDVDEETLRQEREILLAQAKNENEQSSKPKPDAIIEKMVDGRMNKYYSEYCLLEQAFVKDDKQTVAQHVAQVAKELGGKITVTRFVRMERGEGIEKREDNLAEEVAKMVGGK